MINPNVTAQGTLLIGHTYLLHGAESNWFAASQEIPHISRNPKAHYRTHKRPPPVSPEQTSRMCMFLNISILQGGVVSTSPNPQAGGPPLIGCPRLLIQYIRSYPPYRRPFLYPQPEDAPCRGERDPLHGLIGHSSYKHQNPFLLIFLSEAQLFNVPLPHFF